MILLDTAAWIWWVADPDRLSTRARKTIESEESKNGLVVSAISVWEVAVKVALGKLQLNRSIRSWIEFACSYPGLSVVPIEPIDALESTLLPGAFHRDPADRLLIALSRRLEICIVTSDRAMRKYRHVETIW